VDIQALGEIEVRTDPSGEPLPLGGPTQRRLFAYLLDRSNSIVSIDRLVEVTWSDGEAPPRAEHNVRTYVHRLRQSLGDHGDRLETLGAGYRLHVAEDEVDLRRFLRSCEEAKRQSQFGNSAGTLDHVRAALTLWEGPPYAEFRDESWTAASRNQADAAYLSLRELRADVLLETGDSEAALAEAHELTAAHPLHEGPQRLVMTALASQGQRAEALRSFQSFRSRLIDEIGIEPSDALYELDRSIAAGVDVEPSPTFAGSYQLHECIGGGASALVYRATQRSLDREVAVKVIRSSLASKPEFIRRFEGEARMVARVDDPAVVPLHDFWRDADRAYLVMRHMPGGTLERRLENGPLPMEDVIVLADALSRALDAAHSVGVVHRDIKPANVLYDNAGRPALADFGIAIDLSADDAPLSPSSHSTPISPEQIREEPIGPAADIHGLGVLTYVALTGRQPFEIDDPVELRRAWEERPLPSVASFDVTDAVDPVLRTATASDPAARYPSGSAFANALRTALAQPTATRSAAEVRNPYRGLEAFTESDTDLFFGRQRVIDELLGQLDAGQRFVGIVGASGAGKSSVARAGLLPALHRGAINGSDGWFITTMTPASNPFAALATAIERVAVRPAAQAVDELRSGEIELDQLLATVLPANARTVVLLVDQLEELYTRCDPEDAERFLATIAQGLSGTAVDLRLISTLRADYFDRPLRHQTFAQHLRDGTHALTPMEPAELHEAIQKPADAVGVELEDGLASELMAEVSGEADALPILQFALFELFERRTGSALTLTTYRDIGGVAGAIGAHAETLFDRASPSTQAAIREVLTRLVSVNDSGEATSLRRSLAEVADSPENADAVTELTDARLLSTGVDPSSREPTIRIAHEALTKHWPRLDTWIDNDRAMLRSLRNVRTAAATWGAEGETEADLFRGVRLDAAADVLETRPGLLSSGEMRFVEESLEAREREQQRKELQLEAELRTNRRLRRLVGVAGALLVAALVAGGLAISQRADAVGSRASAETARDDAVLARADAESARDEALAAQAESDATAFDAETARLAATSASLAERNPRVAMLLALAAHQREPSPQTLGALQIALTRAGPLLGWLGYGTEYIDVEWISDDRLVGARLDGLDLFDLETGQILDSLDGDIGRGSLSPVTEKSRVDVVGETVVFLDGASLRLVDVHNDAFDEVAHIASTESLDSVVLSPDASTVVTSDVQNVIRWFTRQGQLVHQVDVSDDTHVQMQSMRAIGPTFIDDLLREFPVTTRLFRESGQVVAASSVEINTFGWDGVKLAGPATGVIEYAPGVSSVSGVWAHFEEGGETITVGADGIWSGSVVREARQLDVRLLSDFAGGGRPDIVQILSAEPTSLRVLLEDGTIFDIDRSTLEGKLVQDLELERSTGGAVSPGAPTVVAVASPAGISITSLNGAGPLAQPLPRPPQSGTLSIARDGTYAAMGGTGAFAPPTLYRSGDDGWQLSDEINFDDEISAAIGFDRDIDIFGVGNPGTGTVFYRLDPDGPVEVSRGVTNGNAAIGTHFQLGLMVLAGLVVEVYEFPSLDSVATLRRPGNQDGTPTGAVFHPDGTRFVLSDEFGNSDLWNTSDWTLIHDSVLAESDIATAQWSDDGALLATSSSDGTVSIRDGETYEVIREMVGAVGKTAWNNGTPMFSSDRSILLTAFDNVGRLWDVNSGEQIGLPLETATGTLVGANRGESLQLITGTETAALVWNLDMDAWPEIACRTAASNLTQAEWEQWGPQDTDRRAICPDYPLD